MKVESLDVRPGVPVRWPFRILAALVVLAGVVDMIGASVIGWSHQAPSFKWQFLASLPGVACAASLACSSPRQISIVVLLAVRV